VTLHVHLGLVGKFVTHNAPPRAPSSATRLTLENGESAAYSTGPMTCSLVDKVAAEVIVGRLGPDPLRRGTRMAEF
jgi:endonuclease-8